MYSKREVARTIDHAVLKPFATDEDVREGARMCADRDVYSICVRPTDVSTAAAELEDSETCVSMVVGFPHGAHRPEVKALEALRGIEDGAEELDMVMNIGKFLSGEYADVREDINSVVEMTRGQDVEVKVILETCYLSGDQIADACRIAEDAGADFVKTSTGFGREGATPEAVAIMLETVGDRLKVKASGGIRDWATAVKYLEQGCTRLGVGSTEALLDGAKNQCCHLYF